MRIIIVEDEPRSLRGLHNLICSIGEEYEIIAEATDGNKALEQIVILKPDIVFTDIQMPFMNGIALIQAVQKYRIKTKFVIISAYAEFLYAQSAVSLGVKEYLLKPVTYDEMVEVLIRLSKELEKPNIEIAPSATISKRYPEAHYLIHRAISLIESSFASKLNQEDLAKNLGMTPEYFSYLFHKDTGETFSDYIRDYRINAAKKMMMDATIKLKDVAYGVGYSDTKYFSKVFHKVTGETPAEYMKRIHGGD